MKKIILFMVVLFAGILVFAQEKSKSKRPDQQISVNKEYDDQGNLVRYDSSFVRSWSSDTTLNPGDMDAMRKEIENFMKEGGFSHFLGDSTNLANDPFRDMHHDFFEHFKGNFPDSSFQWADTAGIKTPGIPFSDFGQIREQMMRQFSQFFENDSINPGNQK